ncbi:MAG TPA: FHA domain-containing protein [Kofleriaceae bacterium]|nr:FHA domain-containing protein [Kofleriaceae bacterium]
MTVQLQLGHATFKLEGMGARVFAGRDPATCQLAHVDATLSRRHAEIWLENGGVFLRDLGSANGTWVDGQPLGHQVLTLRPGQQIWLGHVPLGVTWAHDGSKTSMAAHVPPELKALIEQHKQQAQQAAPPPSASLQMSMSTPLPGQYAYRRQGSNDNGVLLLALKQDTFFNGTTIDGYVEFTATDSETVASIFVELVEMKRNGSSPHVWDRCIVRQGPWRAQNGDVLPLPFQLRVPAGTEMTGGNTVWEIRGEVDINWASDIDAVIPINMRNQDMERIRDGLGAMDYRLGEIKSVARGQRFEAQFQPPANMARVWGVNSIGLEIEYLGANLKIRMKLDRKGLHHDPMVDQVFELGRLRAASQPEINATLKAMLDQLLPKG